MSVFKLSNKNERFTVFPIKHQNLWDFYKKHVSTFWTVEEIVLHEDLDDWNNKLNDNERFFIKNVLAFFANADGIVNENLVLNFYEEIELPEARQFYAVQIMMESIHCVAPNTRILTDSGYYIIKELQDKEVKVWNGHEFSQVTVRKTSENSQLYKVILSNGMELECTDEHKWHISVGNQAHPERCKNSIIYTKNLEIDDIIITQWSYPTLEIIDPDEFLNPYTHGFFCGDGGYNNTYPMIYLYDKKLKLLPFLNVSSNKDGNIVENRITCQITNMINKDKYFVPINYSLNTKLRWLEGFTDAVGTANLNAQKTSTSIQLSNTNKEFLKNIQLMLSTIGVDSNLKLNHDEEYKLMPTNSKDITRDKYEYYLCKKCYILYISGYNTMKLYNLGFKPNRVELTINNDIKQQKSLVKIVEVIKQEKYSETYCFNEPKNHTGIFNGILTGQCEMYSLLIDTYIQNTNEKNKLFNAIDTNPAVKKKADWALKWITSEKSLIQRILAFVCVEGIFFSGSFCAIYYMKSRGLLNGLGVSNDFIAKDENLHATFAIELYNMISDEERLDETVVHALFKEAVEIEKEFITESLPCKLLGMNDDLMYQYIKYVCDRWITMLGYNKIYNAEQPFGFMEMISLQGKTNFFESRISEYSRAGVGQSIEDRTITFDDEDF